MTEEEIFDQVGEPAALEQLAEECAECAHAALKLSRILRGDNPTPVTEKNARNALSEEFTDVCLCADILKIAIDEPLRQTKRDRWQERLEECI